MSKIYKYMIPHTPSPSQLETRLLAMDWQHGKAITIPLLHLLIFYINSLCSLIDAFEELQIRLGLFSPLIVPPPPLQLETRLLAMDWQHGKNLFDFYFGYWRPFGELLTDMERNGVMVDKVRIRKG